MINLIIITPHGIDTETEIYHCDAKDMTPIQSLKKMWERDLAYFKDGKTINPDLTCFIEGNEEAYLYFKDGSYYHYELSYASSITNFFKYSM
jgi:hypothetical protein